MRQCPACYHVGLYSTFANGTWEEGYCQNCGHESKVPTTKKDFIPVINIEKPKSSSQQPRIRRNK